MADEVRLRRNLAAEKVKASNKKLGNSTAADKARDVSRHYKDLLEHYENFEALHIQLALKLKLTLDDQQLKADYMEISQVVDTAELTYQTYNENKEVRDNVRLREQAANEEKRRQEDDKKKVRAKINSEFKEVLELVEKAAATNRRQETTSEYVTLR